MILRRAPWILASFIIFILLIAGLIVINTDQTARHDPGDLYGKLPLSFEANLGQASNNYKFLSRGKGYSLYLSPAETVISLQHSNGKSSSPAANFRMQLVGANSNPRMTGRDELPGKSNYFTGNDPQKWRLNVPTYSKVRYED